MLAATFQTELITGFLSFLITLLILSYIVGDNPAFRLAIHVFTGVSAGYIVLTILRQVIVDRMLLPLFTGTILERVLVIFPLILSLLLAGKLFTGSEWMGRPVVALLVGVGTASVVAGAVLGTLFPQVLAAANMFGVQTAGSPGFGALAGNLLAGFFALIGTIVTLAYFQFTVFGKNMTTGSRGGLMNILAILGRVFIAITLGAIFAGVLAATLTAFVDRVQSIVLFSEQVISTFIQ